MARRCRNDDAGRPLTFTCGAPRSLSTGWTQGFVRNLPGEGRSAGSNSNKDAGGTPALPGGHHLITAVRLVGPCRALCGWDACASRRCPRPNCFLCFRGRENRLVGVGWRESGRRARFRRKANHAGLQRLHPDDDLGPWGRAHRLQERGRFEQGGTLSVPQRRSTRDRQHFFGREGRAGHG